MGQSAAPYPVENTAAVIHRPQCSCVGRVRAPGSKSWRDYSAQVRGHQTSIYGVQRDRRAEAAITWTEFIKSKRLPLRNARGAWRCADIGTKSANKEIALKSFLSHTELTIHGGKS